MSIAERAMPLLAAGDRLTRDEFLRRWEAMPEVKKAELIGGIVYMPSPLSWEHGVMDSSVGYWLTHYAVHTSGCQTGSNATWLIRGDAPQPDNALRLLPECGGKSRLDGRYLRGAPEFLAEVCLSSAAYDLHQKLELYQDAGVDEYLTVLLHEREVRWHRLVEGSYQLLIPSPEGLLRSIILPGLWLHPAALLAGDMKQVLATLDQGLHSAEHAEFLARLEVRRG